MKWRLALCCFLSAAALSAVAQQEYRVTVLHSFRVPFPRSYGWGIGGGQQVGDSNNLRSGGSSSVAAARLTHCSGRALLRA